MSKETVGFLLEWLCNAVVFFLARCSGYGFFEAFIIMFVLNLLDVLSYVLRRKEAVEKINTMADYLDV